MSEAEVNPLASSAEVAVAGFGHGSVKRKLILVHHAGEQKTFTECPLNEKDFYVAVKAHFSLDMHTPLFLDGIKRLWNFSEITDFFDPERKTDMNVSKETKVLAVVRQPPHMEKDFEKTDFPMIEEERIPHEKMENRPIYQPDIALEEFVDNSLQYTSTCPKKIVYIKHSSLNTPGSKFISVLDSGIGIEHSNITAWARPGVAYEDNKFFRVAPAEGFVNPTVFVGPLPNCKGILDPSNERLYWTLSWYGLGAKLGGANLSEPGKGIIQLKTKPSHGKGTFAQIVPGCFLEFKYRTLTENDVPEDAAEMDTFTEHRISGANLAHIMKHHENDFDVVLNNELANVYYMYLIGPSIYAARLRELCSFKPDNPNQSRQPWDPSPAPEALSLFVQEKKVDPKACFVHRCLKNARCAFSFNIQFSHGDKQLLLYEVNTTLLFFSARDEIDFSEREAGRFIPRSDKCISDLSNRSVFAIWNGKMMPRAGEDLFSWTQWGIAKNRELSDDIFKKIVVLQHYSRAFVPKENKESISDPIAIAELKQHFEKKGLKPQIVAFLVACQKSDAQSYVEYDEKTREITGVRVVGDTRIGFRPEDSKARWQELKFKPQADQPAVSLDFAKISFDKFSDHDGVCVKIYGPTLTGTIWDDGIIYEEYSNVPAKTILNLDIRTAATVSNYGLSYANQTPSDVQVSSTELRAGDAEARVEISLVNKTGKNIFQASQHKITLVYSAKLAKAQPKLMVKSGDDNRWTEARFDDASKVWVASIVPRKAGPLELEFKLACSTPAPALESWISRIKKTVVVKSGEPEKFKFESPQTVQVGVPFEVTTTLLDGCDNPIECDDDSKWKITLTNQPNLKVAHKQSQQKGNLIVELQGEISQTPTQLVLSYSGIPQPVSRKITINPGSPKRLEIVSPAGCDNHSRVDLSYSVSDEWGNKLARPEQSWVHLDVATSPEQWQQDFRIESKMYSYTRDSEPTFAALPYSTSTLDSRAAKAVIPDPFQPLSTNVEYHSWVDFAVPPSTTKQPGGSRGPAPPIRVRCFVGDVFRDTSNNFLRVLSVYVEGGVKKCRLGYIYTQLAIQVPDSVKRALGEDANKAILTDSTTCVPADGALKFASRVWLVSKSAWDRMEVKCKDVYWCDSIYRETQKDIVPLWSGSNQPQKDPIALSVLVGHKLFPSAASKIEIPASYTGAVLEEPSVVAFLYKYKIILNDSSKTKVALYCASFNGQTVSPNSTAQQLGLNSNIPLVIAPIRSCLDESNQTLRIIAPYGNIALWNECRLLVKPDPAPASLRLSFSRADPASLNNISWDELNSTLQAAAAENVVCSIEALDEALRSCRQLNLSQHECYIMTPGKRGKKVVGQHGRVQFTTPKDDTDEYEVHLSTDTTSVSQSFDVRIVSGAPTSLRMMNSPSVASGDQLVLQVQLYDASQRKSVLPKKYRAELHLPEALQQRNRSPMTLTGTQPEPEGIVELLTLEPIHAAAKQFNNLKLVLYDTTAGETGRLIDEASFRLIISPGTAIGFSVNAPAGPIQVESGNNFPKFKIATHDSGGNRIESEKKKLKVTSSCDIISVPQTSEKNGDLTVTITALRSGSGLLSFTYDKFEPKTIEFTILPGQAIINAVAYFDGEDEGERALHIIRSAPFQGRDARIKVNLYRENGVWETARSEDIIVDVEDRHRRPVGMRSQRLSEFEHLFSQIGDYGLKLQLSDALLPGGRIEISPLVLQIAPGNPAKIRWNHPVPERCNAGVSFPLSFTVLDSVDNAVTPMQAQYLTLQHDNSIVVDVLGFLPNPTITVHPAAPNANVRELKTWFSFNFLDSDLEGGKVDFVLVAPPPTAAPASAPKPPQEDRTVRAKRQRENEALKNALLKDMADSNLTLKRLSSIQTAIANWPKEPIYPQDNLSSNLPALAGCFVAGDVCDVEIPGEMLFELAKAAHVDLDHVLAALPARIAQKLFFLNFIVIDPTLTDKSFIALQDDVRRHPAARGRVAACFHLHRSTGVPTPQLSHTVELKTMIRPKRDRSEALQGKLAAFIASKCPPITVAALAEACQNKNGGSYLCLENGVTYNSNETSWDDRQFAQSRKFTTRVSEQTRLQLQNRIADLTRKVQSLSKKYMDEFGEAPALGGSEPDPKRRKL